MPSKEEIIHNYDYLKQFDNETIIYIINEYFNEEDKINLLRNTEFIISFPSDLLEIMINNMNFVSVLNMLQNNLLLNKVNHLNMKLTSKDIIIAKDLLNNYDLIEKFSSNMLKNILINNNKNDILNHLNNKVIFNKLNKEDLVDIATRKRINFIKDINIINTLNKDELIKYINGYFKNNIDYSIINNEYVKETLLTKKDINIDDVNYLYDLLTTKCNHLIQNMKHSVISYKSVMSMYYLFGFSKSLEIISDVKNVSALINTFRYIDMDIVKLNNKLLKFCENNIDNLLNNKNENILQFGTLINNFDSNYKAIDTLENHILEDLNVKNIDSYVLKSTLNNDFNSNLKEIVHDLKNKKNKLKNYYPNIIINETENYHLLNNQELLTINSKIDNDNFTLKLQDNNYVFATIKDNIVYLKAEDNINNNILKEIALNIINNNLNINYVLLNSNKNIDGIRLNNKTIIAINKPFKEELLNKKIK